MSTGGEVGLDWANIGSPTTAQNLSATNIDVDQIVASVSGAVGSVASGGITAASIADNAIDAAALAADVVTELRALVSGTSDSGSTTTMVDAARTEADTDYWAGDIILFTSGVIAGQARVITAFDPATDTITFHPATTQAVSTQTYEILPGERAILAGITHTSARIPNVTLTDTVTTYTGNTPQTGDAFARLGAPAGASVSADILAIDNFVDDLESRLGTPSNLGSGATIAANLVDIEGQTDDIGVAGAGLTAIPWNAAWDAEVQSEVDDALVARFLDKLVLANGTADSGSTTTMVDAARTEADADYWKGRLILFTSGTVIGQCAIITDFNAGTDTFTFAPPLTQAVGTQTYVILPNISVWDDTLAEHLASGSTGAALNAAGGAGDPWSTALPGAYGAGTAGKIVGDNLNATVSSRASQTSVDTIDDFIDTEVAAIKAKTDQLTFTNANKVDSAILTAGDFAQAAADKVWLSATRTLTALGASLVQEIWDRATSALTTAGSIGKLLVDNVNATISSRSSHSAADVWAVADRQLTAISTALRNQVADNILRRSLASAIASADGDTLGGRSLIGAIARLVNRSRIAGTTLTVYRTDDTTTLYTQTLTTNASAEPVIEADTD